MVFCADDSASSSYRHVIVFDADTWEMARVICAEEGWLLLGTLGMAVTEPTAFDDGHEETILAILPDDYSEQVH